ncbi:Stabilin-1 [Geodia barretti]|uniref:Stabilin-1 n=1 Tax=Geodia barretti TaxID=519541 RepID=A0AA35TBH5_GEOBA|nr:Stabilin-1 [Geodia barretti]
MKTCFTIGIAALVLLSIIASATSQGTSPSPAPDNSTTCSEECHDYAECYNNYCTCIYGFTGNGTYCEAIPCYNNPCDENAYCLDQGNGSSTCNCQYGYTGNGTVCTSLCSEDCGRNAYCTRNYTSYYGNEYVCQCNYGYTGDPTDYCYDIDECDYVNCTEYATCYNTNGSYVCECDPGFTGYGGYYCYGKHHYVYFEVSSCTK